MYHCFETFRRFFCVLRVNFLGFARQATIEYIGYECFQKVVMQVKPKYVSCGIQINQNDGFVSESPYTHSFDMLDSIHHQIDTVDLENRMIEIGYHKIFVTEYPLPNGKELVKMDFST